MHDYYTTKDLSNIVKLWGPYKISKSSIYN